jgi:hypothetical protein
MSKHLSTSPLKFAAGNAKLSLETATFSLPCGWACPFAKDCKTRVGRDGGLVEGGHRIRCYAATQELIFAQVRRARWHNYDLLRKAKTTKNITALLAASLPDKPIIRVGVSGDFFSPSYFAAWLNTAKVNPAKVFYAYTKSLRFWLALKSDIPANFKLIASKGGRDDPLIALNGLRFAEVVFSEDEAKAKGLRVTHTDFDIYGGPTDNLALLVHGQQPKGEAAGAWHALNKAGKSGYKAKYGM